MCVGCPSPARRCIACFAQEEDQAIQGSVNLKSGLCQFHEKNGRDAKRNVAVKQSAPVKALTKPRVVVQLREPAEKLAKEEPLVLVSEEVLLDEQPTETEIALVARALLRKVNHRSRLAKTLDVTLRINTYDAKTIAQALGVSDSYFRVILSNAWNLFAIKARGDSTESRFRFKLRLLKTAYRRILEERALPSASRTITK